MRVVIFSRFDMEAMTVIDVPHDIVASLRNGDFIRVMPKLEAIPWMEFSDCEVYPVTIKTITVQMFRLHLNCNGILTTWIGLADDDGLQLQAKMLPGQEYIVQGYRQEIAEWRGSYLRGEDD